MQGIRKFYLAAGLLLSTTLAVQAEEIELWSFIDPDEAGVRSELLKGILEQFEAENPGTTVTTNVIQWTELGAQLLRADRAGSVPDLVMLYSPYMQAQVAAGTLLPLNPLIDAWPEADREDVITVPMAYDSQGNLYGLPYELRAYGIMYRSDLFKEAGIAAPKTIDEMVAALQHFTKDGNEGVTASFNPASSTAAMEWLLPTVVSLGGKVIAEDGSADFQGPAMEQALQMYADLINKHKVMSLETTLLSVDDARSVATSGQAVAHSNGTHNLSTMQEQSAEGAQWTYTPYPALDPTHPIPLSLQGWNLVIPKKAEHPELAWKLIELWDSPEIQLRQAIAAGYLPMRRSVAQSPEFQTEDNLAFGLPAILEYAAANPLRFTWPENSDALNDVLSQMVQQVITGEMTPAEATVWGEEAYEQLRR
jgi:ABC-type glycerol-3-phosphate transport system substrate-binding protein